jgi:hypothetical protein
MTAHIIEPMKSAVKENRYNLFFDKFAMLDVFPKFYFLVD